MPIKSHTLPHTFKNPALLEAALLHPSRRKGKHASMFERLEFLGDRVLGLIMAEWLYEQHPEAREGEMAKQHAQLVNRDVCAAVAQALALDQHLVVAKSERKGTFSATVLADAAEAFIAAVYLDAGLTTTTALVRQLWAPHMQPQPATVADPKSALQELAQSRGLPLPTYKVVGQTGPAHKPEFIIEVSLPGCAPVQATGKNKREAQKVAARGLFDALIK